MGNLRSIIAIMVAVMVCSSCTRKVYVPIERTSVRVDTVITSKVKNDSVYLHDSVYVDRTSDTVKVYRWRTLAKTVQKVDTVYKVREVAVEQEKPVVVKEESPRGVVVMAGIGIGFIAIIILSIVWRIVIYFTEGR